LDSRGLVSYPPGLNYYNQTHSLYKFLDFIYIKVVQENGKKVINAFFPKSSSNALRGVCNNCINLGKELKK